ncbi:hypothetical protein DPMN_124884 [Dreissena polymorpha]|uniref:Uncharacterized protein n=1 Tax=Dreissena polymorpha TaxID=45954 RepID=A0A9D4JSZ5_DREPO|nr:hypothetical protein DPMN_124884 [Dreissena polymorpha]
MVLDGRASEVRPHPRPTGSPETSRGQLSAMAPSLLSGVSMVGVFALSLEHKAFIAHVSKNNVRDKVIDR